MGIAARVQFVPRNDLGQFAESVISPAVRASVEAGCKLIEDSAKSYCPVDSGSLRDSITTEISETDKTVVGIVAPHEAYASFVEYGTGRLGDPVVPHTDKPGMVAQPYMRPALDQAREPVLELFRGQLALAIK